MYDRIRAMLVELFTLFKNLIILCTHFEAIIPVNKKLFKFANNSNKNKSDQNCNIYHVTMVTSLVVLGYLKALSPSP